MKIIIESGYELKSQTMGLWVESVSNEVWTINLVEFKVISQSISIVKQTI